MNAQQRIVRLMELSESNRAGNPPPAGLEEFARGYDTGYLMALRDALGILQGLPIDDWMTPSP